MIFQTEIFQGIFFCFSLTINVIIIIIIIIITLLIKRFLQKRYKALNVPIMLEIQVSSTSCALSVKMKVHLTPSNGMHGFGNL